MKTWIVIGIVFVFLITAVNLGLHLKTKEINTKAEKPAELLMLTTSIKANDWVTIHDGFWDECLGLVHDKKSFDEETGKPSRVQVRIYCDHDGNGTWNHITNENISIKNLKVSETNDGSMEYMTSESFYVKQLISTDDKFK